MWTNTDKTELYALTGYGLSTNSDGTTNYPEVWELNPDTGALVVTNLVTVLTSVVDPANGLYSVSDGFAVLPNGDFLLICADFTNTIAVFLNTSEFQPPGAVPRLAISQQGNVVRIAWPSASPGWSLEQNPVLQQTSWVPCGYDGYSVLDDGTNKSLTLPLSRPNLFFRLLHP